MARDCKESVRNRVMMRENEGPKRSVSERVMVMQSERDRVMARNSKKEREGVRGAVW